MKMMSHEKLDVYKASIKFLSLSRQVIKKIPKGNADIVDQLKRASRSIPLLIAEGVGKATPAHQARYFTDARGSALECAACLDVLSEEKLIEVVTFSDGKELLTRIVSMLTKMVR
jgi:four helix bundle protein